MSDLKMSILAVSVGIIILAFFLLLSVANVGLVSATSINAADVSKEKGEGVIQLSEGPTGIAIDNTVNMLYVSHSNSNTISIINASTNAVTQTINSGGMMPYAVNADNNKLYVANFESDSVSVIDAKSGRLLANITNVNYHPYKIAVNPITNLVYVASIGSVRTLNVIDGVTDKIVYNITLARGDSNGLAINPSTNVAYVTHDFSSIVSVVDISPPKTRGNDNENRLLETLQVGARVFDVTVDAKNNIFYVAALGDSSRIISVIDGTTNRALGNITISGYIADMAVNPEINRIYVANGWSNSTTVIDSSSSMVIDVIPVSNGSDAIVVNPSNNMVYTTNRSNSITLFDGLTNMIVPEFGSSFAAAVIALAVAGAIVSVRLPKLKK